MRPDVPHMKHPVGRNADGSVECVEQDTREHVMSCEWAIVRCPQGFRTDRPEFGWPFPLYKNVPLDLGPLERALAQFEPRGRANAQEWAEEADAAVRNIEVQIGA